MTEMQLALVTLLAVNLVYIMILGSILKRVLSDAHQRSLMKEAARASREVSPNMGPALLQNLPKPPATIDSEAAEVERVLAMNQGGPPIPAGLTITESRRPAASALKGLANE